MLGILGGWCQLGAAACDPGADSWCQRTVGERFVGPWTRRPGHSSWGRASGACCKHSQWSARPYRFGLKHTDVDVPRGDNLQTLLPSSTVVKAPATADATVQTSMASRAIAGTTCTATRLHSRFPGDSCWSHMRERCPGQRPMDGEYCPPAEDL